jgi:hypothetical protein
MMAVGGTIKPRVLVVIMPKDIWSKRIERPRSVMVVGGTIKPRVLTLDGEFGLNALNDRGR